MPLRLFTTRNLRTRFLRAVGVGASLSTLVTGLMVFDMTQDKLIERSRQSVALLINAVENTAAVGVYANDQVLLAEVARGLKAHSFVARVELRNPDGKPLVTEGGEPLKSKDSAIVVDRELYAPFESKSAVEPKTVVGRLVVRLDARKMRAEARVDALVTALMMALQSLLVTLVVVSLASRMVSRPISRLARRLLELSPGENVSMQVPDRHREDEIGELITSANGWMAAHTEALIRERELRASIERMEAQYRKIFDSSSAGIFVLDTAGRLINSNPTALRIIGIDLESVRSLQGEDFIQRAFARPETVRALIREASSQSSTVSCDLELQRADQSMRWVHCLISVQRGDESAPDLDAESGRGVVEGVMYDITERKMAEHAVSMRADFDSLTELRSRQSSEQVIDQFLVEASQMDEPLAFLYVDLDGFKGINDTHGHRSGDLVLIACAHRMRSVMRRSTDLVGRLGGDEFIVALRGVGQDSPEIGRIASELLQALCDPIDIGAGVPVHVGASVGMAVFPHHGSTRRELLHAADAAMYEVKRSGKNSFAMAVPEATG